MRFQIRPRIKYTSFEHIFTESSGLLDFYLIFEILDIEENLLEAFTFFPLWTLFPWRDIVAILWKQ